MKEQQTISPSGKGKSPSHPSPSEIINMMEEFHQSKAVSVKEFCEMQGIGPSAYRSWQNIYDNSQASSHEAPSGFVSLEVKSTEAEPSKDAGPSLFAEVGGIRLYREVPPSYLKALLP